MSLTKNEQRVDLERPVLICGVEACDSSSCFFGPSLSADGGRDRGAFSDARRISGIAA